MQDDIMEETKTFKSCKEIDSERKEKQGVKNKFQSNSIHNCRVVLKHDLTKADFSKHELTKRFNVYLNFTVTCRTNSLVYKRELTNKQEEIYELIKSMHDSGLGYRRIAKRLRDMNIKTTRGSVFKNNNVFAVIKRYEERQVRLREERNRKYEHKWGKMYLTFERKQL